MNLCICPKNPNNSKILKNTNTLNYSKTLIHMRSIDKESLCAMGAWFRCFSLLGFLFGYDSIAKSSHIPIFSWRFPFTKRGGADARCAPGAVSMKLKLLRTSSRWLQKPYHHFFCSSNLGCTKKIPGPEPSYCPEGSTDSASDFPIYDRPLVSPPVGISIAEAYGDDGDRDFINNETTVHGALESRIGRLIGSAQRPFLSFLSTLTNRRREFIRSRFPRYEEVRRLLLRNFIDRPRARSALQAVERHIKQCIKRGENTTDDEVRSR
jgi:hypothetical protein